MMRTVIFIGKALTLVFWLGELANLFQFVPSPTSNILHITAVTFLAVHAVEAALFTRLCARQLAEPKLHKMLILVFGIFHWMDLRHEGKIKIERPARR